MTSVFAGARIDDESDDGRQAESEPLAGPCVRFVQPRCALGACHCPVRFSFLFALRVCGSLVRRLSGHRGHDALHGRVPTVQRCRTNGALGGRGAGIVDRLSNLRVLFKFCATSCDAEPASLDLLLHNPRRLSSAQAPSKDDIQFIIVYLILRAIPG